MNLAILIGRFPPGPHGGAEHQAQQWAARLAARHRVTVITRVEPGDTARRLSVDGYEVVRLPVSPLPVWRTAADARRIVRVLHDLEPRPDVQLCFQSFVSGWAGVRAQRELGIPAAVWIRGEGEYRHARRSVERRFNPRTWSDARAVLVQTDTGRRDLLAALERDAPWAKDRVASHLEVLPNGIDLPAAHAGAVRGGGVLAVGRLIPDKGVDLVIDAVAGRAPLVVAGDGPDRARLRDHAGRRGADATFTGFLDRTGLAKCYREAACVVLAARHGEGMPNALLEAMAHGCPVVATRVGGVADLVADDVSGLLVPPGDAAALRDAVGRVLSDPGLAARLGTAARRTAEGYAWNRLVPHLEALLERWSSP